MLISDERAAEVLMAGARGAGLTELGPAPHGVLFGRARVAGKRVVVGSAVVADRTIRLAIAAGPSFPVSLPKVFVAPADAVGFVPHVDEDGFVCFASPEGLVLDTGNPIGIVTESVRRACETLAMGVRGENLNDFADELEAYWARIAIRDGKPITYRSIVTPGHAPREIVLLRFGADQCFADSANDLLGFWNGVRKSVKSSPALYIPLKSGTAFVPPAVGAPMWSAAELARMVFGAVAPEHASFLHAHSQKSTFDTVLLGVPRSVGGYSLVAVRASGAHGRNPLDNRHSDTKLRAVAVERWDRGFLVPRGGGAESLAAKRVLIVGVGSIGGRVAEELARTGVLQLTLVDPEKLGSENSFRHVCGRSSWGSRKVAAVQATIERELPFVRVGIRPYSWEIIHQAGLSQSLIAEHDLVICATGNVAVELEINRLARETSRPALFTWLEPLGIGGHAVLSCPAKAGCLRCAYTQPDGTMRMHSRLAFARDGQAFGIAISGCGSLHTPYSSLDASRTAEMASRLAVNFLSGREADSGIARSWKGDASDFEEAGYLVSTRYAESVEELVRQERVFAVGSCPICGADQPAA